MNFPHVIAIIKGSLVMESDYHVNLFSDQLEHVSFHSILLLLDVNVSNVARSAAFVMSVLP
jgi:hypothetical protein